MNANAACTVMTIAMFGLIGFLCWHFNNGWPCLILFGLPFVEHSRKDKDNKSNSDTL